MRCWRFPVNSYIRAIIHDLFECQNKRESKKTRTRTSISTVSKRARRHWKSSQTRRVSNSIGFTVCAVYQSLSHHLVVCALWRFRAEWKWEWVVRSSGLRVPKLLIATNHYDDRVVYRIDSIQIHTNIYIYILCSLDRTLRYWIKVDANIQVTVTIVNRCLHAIDYTHNIAQHNRAGTRI